jgi:serine/threonine protein kinase
MNSGGEKNLQTQAAQIDLDNASTQALNEPDVVARSRGGSLALSGKLMATGVAQESNSDLDSTHVATDVAKEAAAPLKIGAQHFELRKLIGAGAFGKVILATNLLNDRIYAMKVISKKLLRKKNHVLYMKVICYHDWH